MSTIDEKIKRLEEIQKSIFNLSGDILIEVVGSDNNEVQSILTQIRKESTNISAWISTLKNEIYDDKQETSSINTDFKDNTEWMTQDFTCDMNDDRVIIFFTGCKKINEDNNKIHFPNVPLDKFKMTQGRRYIKVIRGGSVHCFIDRTNGDVLKAASWSTPAKHARGNIWDDFNGLKGMTEYGAAYMRGQ